MEKIKFILYRILLNPIVYLIVTILLLLSIRLVFIININPNAIIILIAVCSIIGDWIMSNVDISDIDNNMQETMHEWHEDYKNDAEHERIANYINDIKREAQAKDLQKLDAQAKEHARLLKENADNIKDKGKEKEVVASSSKTKVQTSSSQTSDIPITMLSPEDEVKLIQQRSNIKTITSSDNNNTTQVQESSKGKEKDDRDVDINNKEKEIVAASFNSNTTQNQGVSSSMTKGELTELDRKALHEIKNNLYNSDSESDENNKETKSDIVTDIQQQFLDSLKVCRNLKEFNAEITKIRNINKTFPLFENDDVSPTEFLISSFDAIFPHTKISYEITSDFSITVMEPLLKQAKRTQDQVLIHFICEFKAKCYEVECINNQTEYDNEKAEEIYNNTYEFITSFQK
jgi:hypothetical protein